MTKRTVKKAKEIVRKKKKKELDQSMNETISFVIKGKLTPLKPMEDEKPKGPRKKVPERKIKIQRKEPSPLPTNQDDKKQAKNTKQPPNKVEIEEKDPKSSRRKLIKFPTSPKKQKKEGAGESPKTEILNESKRRAPIKKEPKRVVVTPKTVGTKSTKKPLKQKQKNPEDQKPKVTAKRKRSAKESPPTIKESPPLSKEKEPQTIAKEAPSTTTSKDVEEPKKIKTEPMQELEKSKTVEQVEEASSPIKEESKCDDAKESESEPESSSKTKKKMTAKDNKAKIKRKADQRRKMKLFSLWTGPKRHRVASLNALAKVHCLYENESRGNIIDNIQPIKREPADKKEKSEKAKAKAKEKLKEKDDDPPPTRTLRTAPGMRGVGRHWDMHDTMSSSSSEDTSYESSEESVAENPKTDPPTKPEEKKPPVKRRKRNEVIMDLKDMVVRKRMASLNASAILAASYSLEKNSSRSPRNTSDSDTDSDSYSDDFERRTEDDSKKDDKLIEVRATPNKKVAVIVNQDTDVTITGVYVNSTTRSTHHEGYCSIAGMQYRISATSHTQTAATAVATETLLQSASSSSQENSNGESTPSKSYTPLDALSNMQPPSGASAQHSVPMGHHHLGPPHISPQLSPLPRRHGCSSAFSAPPGHYPAGHHHPPTQIHPEQGYIHGKSLKKFPNVP